MGNGFGNMNHFWKDVSYGAIDLQGSKSFGWFVMSQPSTSYSGNSIYAMALDCLASVGSSIDLKQFHGINFVFNVESFAFALGGYGPYQIPGARPILGVTWTRAVEYPHNAQLLAHEMGHGFGLLHSHDPYGREYNNPWDFMSSGRTMTSFPHRFFPTNTIAPQKELLGWIAPANEFVLHDGSRVILLENLSDPDNGAGILMVEVPFEGGAITLEARTRVGYDYGNPNMPLEWSTVPGEGVVVHRVAGSRPTAWVMDFDRDGFAGDDGSVLEVGESVIDSASTSRIEVLRRVGDGFEVSINLLTELTVTTTVTGSGSITSSPAGIDCPPVCDRDFPTRKPVLLEAQPSPGWLFAGWSGGCSGAERCEIPMSWHHSVGASFVRPDIDVAADHLLGGWTLSSEMREVLDRNGNRNGFYDIGDFLKALQGPPGE